jgi:capsular polysaccharide biosynthesis protein
MELKQFLIMLRKKLVLIIVIPILVSIITAFISTLFITPVYEASSTLYIINQKLDNQSDVTYDELLTSQQLVKDYRELINSKLIMKTVLEDLNIHDITPASLSKKITVKSKNDTRVLEIKVKDTNPVRCMELSNKICTVFINKSPNLTKTYNISVVDTAEIPAKPVKPKPIRYTLVALLASLIAVIGIFYLLEIINETINTSEDIETYLELSVLGTMPSFNIK